jgi:hypothetical protein
MVYYYYYYYTLFIHYYTLFKGMSLDSVWSLAIAEGEPSSLFVGRESGVLEKYSNAALVSDGPSLVLHGHLKAVTAIAPVSADDVYSASLDGALRQWSTGHDFDGKRDARVIELGTPLRALLQVGDQFYAGGADGCIYVVIGTEVTVWRGHQEAVVAIAQTDGVFCSGSFDNQIRVWDSQGRLQFILMGHTNHVRGVQFVSATTIMSSSRDESIRIWNIPEVSTESRESKDNSADAESASHVAYRGAVPLIKPSGTIYIPSTPHTFSIVGSYTFFGTSDNKIYSINSKDAARIVAEYEARIKHMVRMEKVRVEREKYEALSFMKKKMRVAIKNKRRSLVIEEKKAAAEAAAQKRRAEHEAAEGDDEEEAQLDDAPPLDDDDGGGDDTALTPEHEEELRLFSENQKRKFDERVAKLQQRAHERVAKIDPMLELRYTSEAGIFFKLPFSHYYPAGDTAVVALAVSGRSAFAANGAKVSIVTVTPGVTILQ